MRCALVPFLVVLLGASCSRDHSALAVEGTGGQGGDGGAASTSVTGLLASTGVGGGMDAGGGDSSSGGGATSGGGGEGAGEPDGPPRLVFVHGVVDRARVAACFANDGGEGLGVAPTPRGGLPFATSIDVEASDLPRRGDVVVVLVAGDEADLEDATCDALLDEPESTPELERMTIGSLPRSALEAPRALLLIGAGCIGQDEVAPGTGGGDAEGGAGGRAGAGGRGGGGGAGGDDGPNPAAPLACGAGFGPGSPTATLVATSPSRIVAEGRVALQVVGGALAAAPFDVQVSAGDDDIPLDLAEDVSLGAALPVPPDTSRDALDLMDGDAFQATALLPNQETVLATVDLGAAMERAGVDLLEDGRGYAIVLVGPTPTLGPGPFWPAFDAAFIPVGP